uniref:Uncharacterized protein n=1 Tax=Candidatus Kentrum sp. DK TaxID=2126562 RepID=A0A450S776_9GAMM|nr:MAG: hypothetical protein BECKDK2373B_GA0170837_101823 [Candidatus Kentron sp. DK]
MKWAASPCLLSRRVNHLNVMEKQRTRGTNVRIGTPGFFAFPIYGAINSYARKEFNRSYLLCSPSKRWGRSPNA